MLVDTNVLVRIASETRSGPLAEYLKQRSAEGDQLCIAQQSLFELWSVMTRPAASNGYDLAPVEAAQQVMAFRSAFIVLADPQDLLDRWLHLCTAYAVKGRPSHDARLVAVADSYGIGTLMTLDVGHLKRFEHLTLLVPPTR